MLMTLIMLPLWQMNPDMYSQAFTASYRAYYEGSDIKSAVSKTAKNITSKFPVESTLLSLGYSAGVRKNVQLTSKVITIMRGTSTTYKYDIQNNNGSIAMSWRF